MLPTTPLQSAVGMLATLGDNASPQLRALRTQLEASLQNQAPR
jgi:hypothetical protein